MSGHTPVPWKVGVEVEAYEPDRVVIRQVASHPALEDILFRAGRMGNPQANAEFVVLAVNHHEELVDLARRLVEWDVFGKDFGEVVKISRRATELLAKVEGR